MKALSANELRKRAFRKFLYDNDALEAWYKNTRAVGNDRLKLMLANVDNSIIGGSFTWSNSPEGHDFWSKLSYKWSKMLEARVD